MMHLDDEDVAIYWDYGGVQQYSLPSVRTLMHIHGSTIDTCHSAGLDITGYEIVDNIRRAAHAFGSVKSFRAYLTLSESEKTSHRSNLRSEYQASGVSLTDCPHEGMADKMMLGRYQAYDYW